jgi:hypothetical protein
MRFTQISDTWQSLIDSVFNRETIGGQGMIVIGMVNRKSELHKAYLPMICLLQVTLDYIGKD